MSQGVVAWLIVVCPVAVMCGCSPASIEPVSPAPATSVDAPTVPGSPAAPAAASTTAAATAPRTVSPPAPPEPSSPPPPADCSTVALRLDITPERRVVATAVETGTANIYALDFTVTNPGTTPCQISGWPDVRFRGDGCEVIEVGVPCPTTVDVATSVVHSPAQPTTVTLNPGGATTFSLKWYELICVAKPASVDVTLPGHPQPIRLAPVDVCSDAKFMDGSDAGPIELSPLGTRP